MVYSEQEIKKVKTDFKLYARNMFPEFTYAKFQHIIFDQIIDNIIEEDGIWRQMISLPPGAGKSFIVNDLTISFFLQRNDFHCCIASYSHTIANTQGKRVRKIIESDTWRFLNPGVAFTTDGQSGSFTLTNGSELYCVGRNGSCTGRRFHYISIDDCLASVQESKSNKILEQVQQFLFGTILTREYAPKSRIVVLNTRFCSKDAIGLLQEAFKDKPWPYLNIEAICEDPKTDLLGRAKGESFAEDWFPLEKLLSIKKANLHVFDNLYQGKCINTQATYIKPEKLALGSSVPLTTGNEKGTIITSWDTASTANPNSDYSVCIIWKVYSEHQMVIADIWKGKLEFNDLIAKYDEINSTFKPAVNLIESASSGLQLLQVRPGNSLACKVFKNEVVKEATAKSFNFLLGEDIFIMPHCLTNEIESEITSYPFGKHDDVVLAIMHGFNQIKNGLLANLPKSKSTKSRFSVSYLMQRAKRL